ncbi:hypothetical protein SAMN05216228_102142 [Rhizobium tibeticum]|uniref:Uncharacterized protein n=1 Tax=Rhizobium tibeticum TaxID=501024 RepID=A0A1H8RC78_9HYPH|nr:hypothetical protein RTCCBAU85039_4241 [Rhizobium tibeticum]SEO64011.1 hypothetical protein SAMN05216228_102142 [Rhizobium tibeticum]
MEGEITFSRNPAQSTRRARHHHVAMQKGPAKPPALRVFCRSRCADQFAGAVGIAGDAFRGAPLASLKKRKNCEFGEITSVVS